MKIFLKKYGQFLFLFLFLLFCFIVSYNLFFGDTIVNYGFSYAITNKQLPYVDFNLIVPLFSPFLYSLFLFISKSFFFYYFIQSILVVMFFMLIFKILGKRFYLLLPLLFLAFPIPLVMILFPGYNFIFLFLIFIVLYLEKFRQNDFVIGIFLGLMLITKHTLGVLFLLPSIYYFRKPKKIVYRFIGSLIPVLVFVFYLLISNSFHEFVNLCILGLFDFSKNNATIMNYWLLIPMIGCLTYNVYCIIKYKKDIFPYYILASFFYIVPLFDSYHISFFVFSTLFLYLYYHKFDFDVPFIYIGVFIVFLSFLWFFITLQFRGGTYEFKNYFNYPFRYMSTYDHLNYSTVEKFIKNQKEDVILFGLGTENYFYKITHNLDITYFDLPNYGNYGYHGELLMKKKFEQLKKGSIILVDDDILKNYSYNQQYHTNLVKYVWNNYEKIKKVGKYYAYQKLD